jgi:hypothetical protein
MPGAGMEHELNHLAGLIERQHGVIQTLTSLPGSSAGAMAPLSITLDTTCLVQPVDRASLRMSPAAERRARPDRPLIAPPGMACFSLRHRNVDVVAVPAFGCRGSELERLVDAVGRLQSERLNFKPVFITDSSNLDPFIRRAFAVEHVEGTWLSSEDRSGLLHRIQTIREKWDIADLLDLGGDADFFCPICNSRAYRIEASDSVACAGCGGLEGHRALAHWCLDAVDPGARIICPTSDAAMEAIGRHLDLDLVAVPIAKFLRPSSGQPSRGDVVMLCASRNDKRLGMENVLSAACRHLDVGGKLAVAYCDDSPAQDPPAGRPATEKIACEFLTRWQIDLRFPQPQASQLDQVPELQLLSARRRLRVQLLVATKQGN